MTDENAFIRAGAPELPEGYFYRIHRTLEGPWAVTIRRKRKGWFSAYVSHSYVFPGSWDSDDVTIKDFVRSAEGAYRVFTTDLRDSWRDWEGDWS